MAKGRKKKRSRKQQAATKKMIAARNRKLSADAVRKGGAVGARNRGLRARLTKQRRGRGSQKSRRLNEARKRVGKGTVLIILLPKHTKNNRYEQEAARRANA
jgi:hypothetical protein